MMDGNRLLAIDASAENCSVALALSGRFISLVDRAHDNNYSQNILTLVKRILDEADCTLDSLDFIAFGRGPGSFTGIRTCAAVTQGLALGARLKVLPVSSLAATAMSVHNDVSQSSAPPAVDAPTVAVIMDARMSQVYWNLYKLLPDKVSAVLADDRLDNYSAAALQLADCWQTRNTEKLILAGNGVHLLPLADHQFVGNLIPGAVSGAAAVARIAMAHCDNSSLLMPEQALPTYIRDSSAWTKRRSPK